jgi:hypothetical protein
VCVKKVTILQFKLVCVFITVCVYDCSTYYKAARVAGGGDSGGHVL